MQKPKSLFMDPLATIKWILFIFIFSQSTIYYSIESPNSKFITPHKISPSKEIQEQYMEKTIIVNDPQSIEKKPLNNNKKNLKVTFNPLVQVQMFCKDSYGLMENSLHSTNLKIKNKNKVLREDFSNLRALLMIVTHLIIIFSFLKEFILPVQSQSLEDVHYLYWFQMINHQCQGDNWWLDQWNKTYQWNHGEVMVGYIDNGDFFRNGLLDNGTHSVYNLSQYPSVNLNNSKLFSNYSVISNGISQWMDKGFNQNFQRWVKTKTIQDCYKKIFNNSNNLFDGNGTAKIHELSILTNASDGSQYNHIIRGPHGNLMAIESIEKHIINNISYDLMVGKAIDNGGFVVDDEKFLFSHLPLKSSLESGATQYPINYGNKTGTLRCNQWVKNRFKNCTLDLGGSSQWMILNNNNWFHGIMNMVGYGVNNGTRGQYTEQKINGWQWNSLKVFDSMEGYWDSNGQCNPLNIFSQKSKFQGLMVNRKDLVLKKSPWTTEDFLGTVDIPHWFMDLNWSANHTEKNSSHPMKVFLSGAAVFPKERPQIITSCSGGSYNSNCYGPNEPLEPIKVKFKNDNEGTLSIQGLGIQTDKNTNPSDNQWIFRINGIPWQGDVLRSKINGADIILPISSKFFDVYQWKTSNNCKDRPNEIYKNFLNINFVNNFLTMGVPKEKTIHINNNHFLNQSSFFFPIEIYNNPSSPLLWNTFNFDGQPVGCNERCFVLDFNGFPQRVLDRTINLPPLLDMKWTVHRSMVWHGTDVSGGIERHHCDLHWIWSRSNLNLNDYVFVCWVNPSQVRFIYKIKDESMWFPATTNGNFWNILLTNGETIAIEKTSGLGFNRGNNHRYPSSLLEKTDGPWLLGNGTFNQTIQGDFFNFKYPHEIILRSNFTFSPRLFDDHFQLKGVVYNTGNNQYQLCQNDNFKNIFCFDGHWQWGMVYHNFFNPNPTFLNKIDHHKWNFYQWLNGSQSTGYNFFPRTNIFTQSTSFLWDCKLIEFLLNKKFPMVLGQWCQRKNNNQINTIEIPLHSRWDHHINQWVNSVSHWFPCVGTPNKCQFKLLNGIIITCDNLQCWNFRGLLNNNYIDRLLDQEYISGINKYINNTAYLIGLHPQKKYYFPSLLNDKIHGIILEPMELESIIYWNYYSYPLFMGYVLSGLAIGLFYKWAQSLYPMGNKYWYMKKFFVTIHGFPFLALDILNLIIHSSIVFGPSAAMINSDQYRYAGSLNTSYFFTGFWMLWVLLELVWGSIIIYNPWFLKFHHTIDPLVHVYGKLFNQKNKIILFKNLILTIPRIIIQILIICYFPPGEIFKVQNYKEINLPL